MRGGRSHQLRAGADSSLIPQQAHYGLISQGALQAMDGMNVARGLEVGERSRVVI